ncbi:glycosyltransferase family 4 protein [Streptomyces sp. NPDC026206]|uniref:glycosyltransferase family 4 protein n=1 Tax=Streptomyces sp. NPDC026206 TaxID=3157089 RepID=UPI0033E0288A
MSEVLVEFGGYGLAQHAGAERMGWRTTERLAARGHRVVVRTDSAPPPGLDREAVRVVAPGRPVTDGRLRLVHAYDLGRPANVAAAMETARAHRVPFVLTPATTVDLWPDRELGRRACRQAAVVYALPGAERARLRSAGVKDERIWPIPQAPDLTGRPDPPAFRARHAIDGPVVLFVGRRVTGKGYAALLDSAPLVWAHVPDAAFVFAGPAAEPGVEERFRAAADPRIHDLGAIGEQDKHDALAACDVLALPTTADVFPLVFTEAWACGKPVVSGRFPGVEDVVRHGQDGLITGSDVTELAAALVRLLRDGGARRAMGAAGLARARREFGWEAVAACVEAGYRLATEDTLAPEGKP